MITLPIDEREVSFMQCCGKNICCGCNYKNMTNERKKGDKHKCAFCRQPRMQTAKNNIKSLKRLMKKNDPVAYMTMAGEYNAGQNVMQSDTKTLEMFTRAAELGYAEAYVGIGLCYKEGLAVERDMAKVFEFHEVAAKKGSLQAHRYLAVVDTQNCIEHLKLAACAGAKESMDDLMVKYKQKLLSKEDLTQTLRAFQASCNEMKSKDREEAKKSL